MTVCTQVSLGRPPASVIIAFYPQAQMPDVSTHSHGRVFSFPLAPWPCQEGHSVKGKDQERGASWEFREKGLAQTGARTERVSVVPRSLSIVSALEHPLRPSRNSVRKGSHLPASGSCPKHTHTC